jgi:hypothetical protein
MIITDHIKDLGLVNVSGIGLGMQDSVSIQGECLAVPRLTLLQAPHPVTAQRCKTAEMVSFKRIKSCPKLKQPR